MITSDNNLESEQLQQTLQGTSFVDKHTQSIRSDLTQTTQNKVANCAQDVLSQQLSPSSTELAKQIKISTVPKLESLKYPVPFSVPSGTWSYHQRLLQSVEKDSTTINLLLLDTLNAQQPEAALWLIGKGAQFPKDWQPSSEQQPLYDWITKVTARKEVLPSTLDHFAVDIGYGYKSANLLVLQQQTEVLNKRLTETQVEVPPFFPISDFEIWESLTAVAPEIQQLWTKFRTQELQYFQERVEKSGGDVSLSEQGKKQLQQIRDGIIQYFAKNCYHTIQIQEWLKKVQPEFMIIRSTGKEDTETSSNAGGNLSLPFIKPNVEDISIAIGRVLASYFGEKSITQRLLAKDESLFKESRPFLPVLLQSMIVETGNQDQKTHPLDIPRSGVLFTTQKDKAQGVTFIQTGLGNNEGVVASKVAVDSYFVDQNSHVQTVVRDKMTRFVHKKEGDQYVVTEIPNHNPDLQTSQGLPTPVIQDLKTIADSLSIHYATTPDTPKALDMEYTVKLREKGNQKPIIYLLQARPLLSGPPASKPSYLNLQALSQKLPAQQRVNAGVLIDINHTVKDIHNPQEIAFADTLPGALSTYMQAPDKIKAIVIRQPAPATSHEAVVLRPKGVSVFVVDNPIEYARVQEFAQAATPTQPLKLDTQRGILVSTAELSNPDELVMEGLVSYPIPREISVPRTPISDSEALKLHFEQTEKGYTSLLKELVNSKADLYSVAKKQTKESVTTTILGLFEVMAVGTKEEAKRALATVLTLLHAFLAQQIKDQEQIKKEKPALMHSMQALYHLFSYAVKLSREQIIPALDSTKPQTMERLFPLKFLEAAIFQQPGEEVTGGFSFATYLGWSKITGKFDDQTKQVTDRSLLVHLLDGQAHAMSQATIAKWKEFISEVQTGTKQRNALIKQQLDRLKQLNVFPLWLNVIFAPSWKKGLSTEVITQLETVLTKNEQTLNWVEMHRPLIPTAQQIEQWGDPDFAAKEQGNLAKLFLDQLGYRSKLTAIYNDADELGRLALLQFIRDTVNTYDLIIKEAVGSVQLSNKAAERGALFAKLLDPYFVMMQTLFSLVPEEDANALLSNAWSYRPLKLADYIDKLRVGTDYQFGIINMENPSACKHQSTGFADLYKNATQNTLPDPKLQFDARPEFSVESMVVGANTDLNYSVHWPSRLEEYFTTFHQNMEFVSDHLTNKMGLNEQMLSGRSKEICQGISDILGVKIAALTSSPKLVKAVYRIPLRQHAGALVVSFDPSKPDAGVMMTARMMGSHEEGRWYQTAFLGAYLGNSPGIKQAVPPQIKWQQPYNEINFAEFSITLPPGFSKTDKVIEILKFMFQDVGYSRRDNQEILDRLTELASPKDINPNFFASTFWGVNEMLKAIAHDPVKVKDALVRIINNLSKQRVDSETIRVKGANLSSQIERYAERLRRNAPKEFIALIQELKGSSPIPNNAALSEYIAQYAKEYSSVKTALKTCIAEQEWFLAVGLAEEQQHEKEIVEALSKLDEKALSELRKSTQEAMEKRSQAAPKLLNLIDRATTSK